MIDFGDAMWLDATLHNLTGKNREYKSTIDPATEAVLVQQMAYAKSKKELEDAFRRPPRPSQKKFDEDIEQIIGFLDFPPHKHPFKDEYMGGLSIPGLNTIIPKALVSFDPSKDTFDEWDADLQRMYARDPDYDPKNPATKIRDEWKEKIRNAYDFLVEHNLTDKLKFTKEEFEFVINHK